MTNDCIFYAGILLCYAIDISKQFCIFYNDYLPLLETSQKFDFCNSMDEATRSGQTLDPWTRELTEATASCKRSRDLVKHKLYFFKILACISISCLIYKVYKCYGGCEQTFERRLISRADDVSGVI